MLGTLVLNCIVAGSGFLTLGIFMSWPATALPSIRDSLDYPLSIEYQSWIGSTGYVGALIGTVLSIFISKYVGARKVLIFCGGASLIGWIFVFISSSFTLYMIYPGLFLIGLSGGLSCPMSSIYVSELAGGRNKGVVTSIFNLNLGIGILLANILGVMVKWSYSSLTIALVHAVLFLALFSLITSPNELARAGNSDKMIEVLKQLRHSDEDVIKEATMITKAEDDDKMDVKKGHIERMKSMDKAQFGKLGIILVVFSLTNLSGINVVNAFLVDIFSSTDISEFMLVIVISLTEIISGFVQMTIADMLGRKTFLAISGLGTSFATAAFAAIFWKFDQDEKIAVLGSSFLGNILSSNIFLVSCLIAFYVSINIGFAPVKYTLLSEMFTPTEQKTIAGLCYTWYWLFGFIILKMFHLMKIKFGLVIIFISISAIMVASVFFIIVFVQETRKKKEKVEEGSA